MSRDQGQGLLTAGFPAAEFSSEGHSAVIYFNSFQSQLKAILFPPFISPVFLLPLLLISSFVLVSLLQS